MLTHSHRGSSTRGAPQVILLCERDESIRRTLKRSLSFEGFAIVPVPDLLRALAYVDLELTAERPDALPDVIVTSVPEWGPGHAASLSLIRRISRRIPVVVLTGLADTESVTSFLAGTSVEVLEKPVSATDLRAALRRAERRRNLH